MRARPLGKTGLDVTEIGLGLAAIGRPGYINVGHAGDLGGDRSVPAMRTHAHAMLDAAFRLGIRYLDVARSYGRGEAFLGSWLERHPQEARDVTVGSKWGYVYTAGWQVDAEVHEVKDHSSPLFPRQRTETRALLGDHLSLYQIHSATLDTGVLEDVTLRAHLFELAEEGVTVGLSLSGPAQAATLERALDLTARGEAPFASVQATWNLLEPSVGDALAAAHQQGWGVIVKEAVANGRLTPRGDDLPVLHEIASGHDVTVDAVAIAAALANPFVDVVLSGAATVEQLESNVTATGVGLDDGEREALAELAETPGSYWARRGALQWT